MYERLVQNNFKIYNMSGLAAFFKPDSITFTVDALVTLNDNFPMTKVGSTSKVNFYPHLKCCVVALGYTRLGRNFDEFINSLVVSDIVDLIDLTERFFLKIIDTNEYSRDTHKVKEEADRLGDIYIMGYSDKLDKLCSYKIGVRRDSISSRSMNMNTMKYLHPPINEEIEDQIINRVKASGGGVENVLIEIMKQMAKESEVKETHRVGVGMEIHLVTMMAIDGNFICSFATAHRFEDYEENMLKMANNQEEVLLRRAKRKPNERELDNIAHNLKEINKAIKTLDSLKS